MDGLGAVIKNTPEVRIRMDTVSMTHVQSSAGWDEGRWVKDP